MSLEAKGLTLAYAREAVLHDLDLRIAEGEFVALIGPNGAGKSALLRALGRLMKPRLGSVRLDDADLWSLSPRRVAQRIAWVSSTTDAPPDLTVRDLLLRARFPHHRLLAGDPRDGEAIAWALDACDLRDLEGRRLSSLSAGERQRASIAAGLAQQPSVLLLDEPTAFLDIQHALEVLSLLTTLNREQHLTIVVALHDLLQAARYAGRVVVLDRGRVVADGPPEAVLVPSAIGPVFGVELSVLNDPVTGQPVILPYLRTPG